MGGHDVSGAAVEAVMGPGVLRTRPLPGEMTLSFLGRVAAGYGLAVREMVVAVVEGTEQLNLIGTLGPDSEVFLDAQARARVAALCRVPQEVLRRALPAWAQEEPRRQVPVGPAAQFQGSTKIVLPWGPGCPQCTSARTGRSEGCRLYLAPHQRVCPRHRYWLLEVPGTAGRLVDLARCPQVLTAHRRHRGLMRRSAVAEGAFEVAQAVTASWWSQAWPREHVWPARMRALAPAGLDPGAWRLLARAPVTYPETVALAGLLADPGVRRRMVAEARGHLPHRLVDLPGFLAEVTARLDRPWLAEQVKTANWGPLYAWAYHCVRTQDGATGDPGMWTVISGHHPGRPADEGVVVRHRGPDANTVQGLQPKRRLGHSRHADKSFTTGLAHTRTYFALHGHLATRKDAKVGSFMLGEWFNNLRSRTPTLTQDRVEALNALDPWWNVPWYSSWQRSYHRARDHVALHGPLDAPGGFRETTLLTGDWLYLQCTQYHDLHPEQQRLLADLGLSAEAVRTAQPRRANAQTAHESALAHARAHAAEHGHLALKAKENYHGFHLGNWLHGKRYRARQAATPPPWVAVLDAIDPWWNAPWGLAWQRDYHQALAHKNQAAPASDAVRRHAAAPGAEESAIWLTLQSAGYDSLRPGQQQLLAALGITAPTAPRLRPDPPLRRTTFPAGLVHAHAHTDERGHLALLRQESYLGFPLGYWLFTQRARARRHTRLGTHWEGAQQLAELDPWWNPPWPVTWQRSYQLAAAHIKNGGSLLDPPTGDTTEPDPRRWARWQQRDWAYLGPERQAMLHRLGLTGPATTRPPNRAETTWYEAGLQVAQLWHARHGALAAVKSKETFELPDSTHFNLGSWIDARRRKAARLTPEQRAQLDALGMRW